MNENDEIKMDILRKVNKKIQRRELKMILITITLCVLIVIILYFILFEFKEPLSSDLFRNVRIETNLAVINELDNRELEYSNLCFYVNEVHFLKDMEFYVENNDKDNTSTLYFYLEESNIQKIKNKNDRIHKNSNVINCRILLYPELCKTDKINEITKVCYLVYNYKYINKEKFNEAKKSAIILWEK